MFDVIAVIADLSTQVKIGWAVWLVWSAVLIGWYHRGRVTPPLQTPVRPVRATVDAMSDASEEASGARSVHITHTAGGPAADDSAVEDSAHPYNALHGPQDGATPTESAVAAP